MAADRDAAKETPMDVTPMRNPALRRMLATWLALGLSACGGGLVPRAYAPPRTRTIADEIASVQRVRHAPLRATVPLRVLDDAAFEAAFRADRAKMRVETAERAQALSAFTFAPPGDDLREPIEQGMGALLGFYSVPDRTMIVRKRNVAAAERYTISHELVHALQAQRNLLPSLAVLSPDGRLAARAVVEGDAVLTADLATAEDRGHSFEEALARASRAEDILQTAKPNAPLPSVVQTWIGWPYRAGAAFVADLYRIGGWALVDMALQTPPATTEQVIHLEKYLAGEPAVPVRYADAPPGWKTVAHGTLGELTTREFFAECIAPTLARNVASGWGGDAYTIVTKDGEHGLLWATTWDDEAAAVRFQRALADRRQCARVAGAPPFVSARAGAHVAVVQGIDGGAEIAKGMLSLIEDRPAATPRVSGATPPPRAALPGDFAGHATAERGHWVDAEIGLESDVSDLHVEEVPALNLVATAPGVMVMVETRWGIVTPALEEQVVGGLIERIRENTRLAKRQAWDERLDRVDLSWTTARGRQITFANDVEVRFVFAPACDGKLTYVLVTVSTGFGAPAVAAERWLASVRAPGKDTSGACTAARALGAAEKD